MDFPLYFQKVMLLWQGSMVEIDYGFFRVFGPYFLGKSLGTHPYLYCFVEQLLMRIIKLFFFSSFHCFILFFIPSCAVADNTLLNVTKQNINMKIIIHKRPFVTTFWQTRCSRRVIPCKNKGKKGHCQNVPFLWRNMIEYRVIRYFLLFLASMLFLKPL